MRRHHWTLLSLVVCLGVALRLYRIDTPLLETSPMRQYRTALTARWLHLAGRADVPPWRREVAEVAGRSALGVEAPVAEHLIACVWDLTGGPRLWTARLLSILLWLAGSAALFLLARALADGGTAVVALALYMLNPFGVLMSRALQHDILQVSTLLLAYLLLLRAEARPRSRRWIGATVAATAAVIVKPTALFFVVGAMAGLRISRRGVRGLADMRLALSIALVLAPTVGFILLSPKHQMIGEHVNAWFQAHLLFERSFWRDWADRVLNTCGAWQIAGAAAGVPLLRPGPRRALVVSLLASYLVYGVVFNWTVHSHDYYQLPLLPIVALAAAPAGTVLLGSAWQAARGMLLGRGLVAAGVAGLILLQADTVRSLIDKFDYDRHVRLAEELGQSVGHSARVLVLPELRFGVEAWLYHGEFAARTWPTGRQADLANRYQGQAGTVEQIPAAERLRRFGSVDYFVVLDRAELERQPDLAALLSVAPVVAQTAAFVVWDLRQSAAEARAPDVTDVPVINSPP